MHFDLAEIIRAVGYVGLWLIVFAETGLLVGFFLPGDSLLFTAGFLASQGFFNIFILVLVFVSAAIIGDSVGYAIGNRYGRRLFDREDSRYFKRKYLVATEAFYEKHGGKTLILARFVPIIRTFAPTVAGVAGMPYSRFLTYNVVGGVLWGLGVPVAGFWLGSVIPDVDKYLLPIIAVIIIVSLIPTGIHIWREHREDLVQLLPWRRQSVAVEVDNPEA
ncbi:MAG: VTT domain-containing protein [Chloroflexi bacterium]|nr:VTT domain-containing protein [Chloroflexota bacterium]